MKKRISRNDLKINPSVDINNLDINIIKENAPFENEKASTKENLPNSKVGSSKGGVYPYNINSNTSDKAHE